MYVSSAFTVGFLIFQAPSSFTRVDMICSLLGCDGLFSLSIHSVVQCSSVFVIVTCFVDDSATPIKCYYCFCDFNVSLGSACYFGGWQLRRVRAAPHHGIMPPTSTMYLSSWLWFTRGLAQLRKYGRIRCILYDFKSVWFTKGIPAL